MKLSKKRNAGFTLLETLATVSTVAILASIGTPSYSEFVEKRKLTGTANEIAAFLMLARSSAVKHNQQTTVSFNRNSSNDWCLGTTLGVDPCDCTISTISDNNYCALKYTDSSAAAVIEPQLISSGDHSGFKLAAATTGSGDSALSFDPVRGILADLADIASFTIQSSNEDHELKVNVSATGTVKTCTNGLPLTGFKSC